MSTEISDQQQQFIDDFASLWERFGVNATQGRVLALLYIADAPEMTAADIGEALGISRGSVSQITRQLVLNRMIQRVSRPGDRRDWFRIASNPFGQAARAERAQIGTFIDVFQRGLAIHNTSPPERQRALINSIAFLEDYDAALGEFLTTWKPQTDSETP
jgi:DNA-binding transcriptional regulator GbsR (MarR family)